MIRAPTFNTPKQSYTACLASCSGTSKTMMWPCGVHREKYIRDYCIIYCYCRWWYWSRKKKNCCWWEKIWLESPRSMQRTKAKLHYKRHCLPGMNQNDNDVATWSPQGKYIRGYHIIYCYCRWWCWSRKKKNCCWWKKIWLESPHSMQRTKAKLHYKRRCLPGMNQNDNDVATWSPQGKYIRDYHILYCYCRWWCWSGKEKWLVSTYDHLGPRGRKLHGPPICNILRKDIFPMITIIIYFLLQLMVLWWEKKQ